MTTRTQGRTQIGTRIGSRLLWINLIVLGLLSSVVAFQLGSAQASRSPEERRRTAIVQAVEHAGPAVVSVYADSRARRGTIRRGSGSGVVVHPDGYVITNSHVIQGGSTIRVQLWGDNQTLPARVIRDHRAGDLALLKIEAGRRSFPYVSVCPTSRLMLGEPAIAVGNPRGLGDTITVGVVSAMNRDAKLSSGAVLRNLIQTDAPINTGNSGGALLNLDGELIGIIVSLLPRASGIAFAISGDDVSRLLRNGLRSVPRPNPLPSASVARVPTPRRAPPIAAAPKPQPQPEPITPPPAAAPPSSGSGAGALPPPSVGERGGRAKTPRVSEQPQVSSHRTTPMRTEDFGLVLRDTGRDIRVVTVLRSSAAQRADIKPGDVILGIGGRPVEDMTDIYAAFSATRPGQSWYIEVRRDNHARSVILTNPR